MLAQYSRPPPELIEPPEEASVQAPVNEQEAEAHVELDTGPELEEPAMDGYVYSATEDRNHMNSLHSIDSIGRETSPHEDELSTERLELSYPFQTVLLCEHLTWTA